MKKNVKKKVIVRSMDGSKYALLREKMSQADGQGCRELARYQVAEIFNLIVVPVTVIYKKSNFKDIVFTGRIIGDYLQVGCQNFNKTNTQKLRRWALGR